jgi:alpha-galactosidase
LQSATNEDGIQILLTVTREKNFCVLRASVRNHSSGVVHLKDVAPLWLSTSGRAMVGPRTTDWSIYRNGYQSWSGTRSFSPRECDPLPYFSFVRVSVLDAAHLPREQAGEFRSDLVTAIEHRPSGNTLLAGFLDGRSAFPAIEVQVVNDRCTRWEATVDFDAIPLLPGAEQALPPLVLACGSNVYGLLSAYAELSGEVMQARVPKRQLNGWCSWYYYFTAVDEGAVLENLENAQQLRGVLPLDYLQIDDGYQADVGDWLDTNSKFPHGMRHLAERIRAAGYRAGIWLAPFLARSTSKLFRQHPDWFIRDHEERPVVALRNPLWGWRACYALDTTHPEALAWLREVVATVVGQWRFDILKLDFLYAAALPGKRHDPRLTRAAALRLGLETIRSAAPDAFLIACGCPLGPAVGVVDSMRIGPDVAPYWADAVSRIVLRDLHGVATKHAVRNILTRSFLHQRWWINDPDCLMVRANSTRLTEEEFRTLATAIALTGGPIVLSDRLGLLSAPEIERLRQTLELAVPTPPMFVDVTAGDFPALLVHCSSEQCAIAVFNPLDSATHKTVPLSHLLPHASGLTHVPEFWTGAILPVRDGTVDLGVVPPHGTRVITVPGL